jgi:hypothetical protein
VSRSSYKKEGARCLRSRRSRHVMNSGSRPGHV